MFCMKYFKSTALLVILFFSFSCKDEKGEDQVSGLAFEVIINPDESGAVEVHATAKNAAFFNIYFGESVNETPVLSTDGTATHQYAQTGNYQITVQAHSSSTDFISEIKIITVVVKTDEDIPDEGYTTPLSYPNMQLIWQDEFNGTSINTADWTFESGGHGWGNNELQYYRSENATLQDGHLLITAKKENFQGNGYTSARMITKGKKVFRYGRIDIRALLPKGQGIWPALWMLGNNFPTVAWPACGEIDIMEMIGGNGRENTVYGTLHWDNGGSYACTCDKPGYLLQTGTFNDKFHVFSIVWDQTFIKWYVDDVLFNTIDITPSGLSEFHNDFFLIFNVAVGGNWPGNPNATTFFPQRMVVDYVRVFK